MPLPCPTPLILGTTALSRFVTKCVNSIWLTLSCTTNAVHSLKLQPIYINIYIYNLYKLLVPISEQNSSTIHFIFSIWNSWEISVFYYI